VPASEAHEDEAERLSATIAAAPLRRDPAPHLYLEEVFSSDFYRRMVDEFPETSAFARWRHEGDPAVFFGSYAQRLELRLPRDRDRLSGQRRAFWSSLAAALCGQTVTRAIAAKFREPLERRFGEAARSPDFMETRLTAELMLDKHEPGYYLGPHTDHFAKVMAFVFYMPERAGLDHLGTALYEPREAGFTCPGVRHHDPAGFTLTETMPFRPNSAFVFVRDDTLFHGVERFGEEELAGSERRGFQLQYREVEAPS
jgi:hypothetical protein